MLQDPTLYVRAQKVFSFGLEIVVAFLTQAYDKQYLLDERQGRSFFIDYLNEALHLLYYYVRTPAGLGQLDGYMVNGVEMAANGKEAWVVGFSAGEEGKMVWRLNGYYVKQDVKDANKCEVVNIISRDFGTGRLSLPKFDWNQGSSLDRLSNLLSFYKKEDLILPTPRTIEEILSEIKLLEENEKEKGDVWIEKYKEILKPGPEEFENIEKIDLFNLFGEPYKEKASRRAAGKIKGDLPKNMAGKVGNSRTKEYFASLLTKVKK